MNQTDKFANNGYAVSIVGKGFSITDAIRNYVFEKLSKVEKITDQITEITVTLDTQKVAHTCSILMNFLHFHVKVKATTDNMYASIDKASDRVIKLVRRYKTKLQSHRAKHLSTVDIHVNVIEPLRDEIKEVNDEIAVENVEEEENELMHPIVARETITLKTLTQDEAVMKMEICDDPFLIYRSEEDQKLKVIYRREDENYGLVQVQ